jgi:hypothetical protein
MLRTVDYDCLHCCSFVAANCGAIVDWQRLHVNKAEVMGRARAAFLPSARTVAALCGRAGELDRTAGLQNM